jgi:hypothetical protein
VGNRNDVVDHDVREGFLQICGEQSPRWQNADQRDIGDSDVGKPFDEGGDSVAFMDSYQGLRSDLTQTACCWACIYKDSAIKAARSAVRQE